MKNKAKFKFNNGNLAIFCSRCNKIIKIGVDFTEQEMMACRNAGSYYMPPKYCDECKNKIMETYKDKYDNLSSLIETLRDIFPFDKNKDYDSGYSTNNEDGWQCSLIIRSPEDCMLEMIHQIKATNSI